LSRKFAPGAWLGNRLWQLLSWRESWHFHSGLNHLRQTQLNILRTLMARQSGTSFGKRHSLATVLGSYERFRDQVPLSTYEDLLPFLRQSGGLSLDKIRVWEPTGGSSGGSKWIPWTSGLQAEFQRAVAVWICDLFRQSPALRNGRAYWQLTPKTQSQAPPWLADHRVGFESDGEYLGLLGRCLEPWVLVKPAPAGDFWKGTVTRLRAASDLRWISCWSPSFLLLLHRWFEENLGDWRPEQWWPELRLISCWTQAASASFVNRVKQLFPGVRIQPKGLLSTEAVVTIPLAGRHPLAYRSHFFEFLSGDRALPSWELETGLHADVVVTTGGGLTRYRTGDRIRVTGFLGQVPCLEFLGRTGVADQRGEKLAIAFLESLLAELSGFAMLAFEGDSYVLFFDSSRTPTQAAEQVAWLESRLMESYTYLDCRQLGQIGSLRGFLVDGDALSQYIDICRYRLGQGLSVLKPMAFHSYQGWSEEFRGEFLCNG
jgi:hypothetical protein